MKIASTGMEMFGKRLFSFFFSNVRHLCLKISILDVDSIFDWLNLQSLKAFSFFTVFSSPVNSRKHHFSDSKHFHDRGLHFHLMNVSSTAVDLIST